MPAAGRLGCPPVVGLCVLPLMQLLLAKGPSNCMKYGRRWAHERGEEDAVDVGPPARSDAPAHDCSYALTY